MKIVVVDGYALNPGDLSWKIFESFGEVVVYPRTNESEWLERLSGASIVIDNKFRFDTDKFRSLPALKYIGLSATGFDVIDIDAAKAHGVTVTNIPAYSTDSVAQHIFALLLEITQQVGLHAAQVKAGAWHEENPFTYLPSPLVELAGLTMGIVGFGEIGRRTAAIAKAFNMNVIAHTRSDQSQQFPAQVFVDLDTLLKESDVVVLCCPLTRETRCLINERALSLMKSSAVLINTSRGGVVDEVALSHALQSRRIYAAGLDVLTQEPPYRDHPLIHSDYTVVTPHVAWATLAARQRCMQILFENLKGFLEGRPVNIIS